VGLNHRGTGRAPDPRAPGRTYFTAPTRAGSRPAAVGDAGCREGPVRPPGPAGTGFTNSISASPGRCHDETRPRRPSWGGSCLGPSGRPSAAARVTPGIPRRAIPVVFQERSTANPPLITADGEEIIPKAPLEFLSFILRKESYSCPLMQI